MTQAKKPKARRTNKRMIDPTPEEIAQRALELRMGWTEKEERARYVGPRREATPWRIPTFHFDQSTGTFEQE